MRAESWQSYAAITTVIRFRFDSHPTAVRLLITHRKVNKVPVTYCISGHWPICLFRPRCAGPHTGRPI